MKKRASSEIPIESADWRHADVKAASKNAGCRILRQRSLLHRYSDILIAARRAAIACHLSQVFRIIRATNPAEGIVGSLTALSNRDSRQQVEVGSHPVADLLGRLAYPTSAVPEAGRRSRCKPNRIAKPVTSPDAQPKLRDRLSANCAAHRIYLGCQFAKL